jgi:hypothetical protein
MEGGCCNTSYLPSTMMLAKCNSRSRTRVRTDRPKSEHLFPLAAKIFFSGQTGRKTLVTNAFNLLRNLFKLKQKRRGGIRALTQPDLPASYRIHIDNVAAFAINTTDHCTLLHAGKHSFGMYSAIQFTQSRRNWKPGFGCDRQRPQHVHIAAIYIYIYIGCGHFVAIENNQLRRSVISRAEDTIDPPRRPA